MNAQKIGAISFDGKEVSEQEIRRKMKQRAERKVNPIELE